MLTEHCNRLGVRTVTEYPTSILPCRMMKSSVHAEEDDFVPELQRSIHPRERPDWEETLSAMVKLLGCIFSPLYFPFWTLHSSIPFVLPEFQLCKWIAQDFEQGQNASLPLAVYQGEGRSFHSPSAPLICAPKQVLEPIKRSIMSQRFSVCINLFFSKTSEHEGNFL